MATEKKQGSSTATPVEEPNTKELELQELQESLNKLSEDLETRKAELDTRESELEAREKALAEKPAGEKKEPEPGLEFEFENEKYKFSDSAPKLISISGKGYTQQEIADNAEIALQLIGGNSSLIKKLN